MRIVRPTKDILQIKAPIEGEEIHVRKVNSFGNGAKIDFFKKFLGEKVLIIVLKNGKPKQNKKLGRKKR